MKDKLKALSQATLHLKDVFKPVLYRLKTEKDQQNFTELLSSNPGISVYDYLSGQLDDLIKINNPKQKFDPASLEKAVSDHLGDCPPEAYGVWVYYPWSARVVHILDESEFIEVRTNRNLYKITRNERDLLARQKIGIVGLSVGKTIALTMAMERSFGEIRLADYDILDLSNLNRLQTGVYNLGLSKTIVSAREISEIDPFLNVVCFSEGLTEANMDKFFMDGGRLDLLVEECDGLDIKIRCRQKAKALKIPVVMDMNDRGMLDVERFDLEPDRPLLHGLIDHLDVEKIKFLRTSEEKLPYMLPMIGAETLSDKLKASMIEVGQTINTWPQLSSSVMLGGALAADVSRRIILNEFHDSGRYWVDLEELITDKIPSNKESKNADEKKEISFLDINIAPLPGQISLSEELIKEIVTAGVLAPSGGNTQPWKWIYKNSCLSLFIDPERANSFLDCKGIASFSALGAASENIIIKAQSLGMEVVLENTFQNNNTLVALFRFFAKGGSTAQQPRVFQPPIELLYLRNTNRKITQHQPLQKKDLQQLKEIAATIPGTQLAWVAEPTTLKQLGELVAEADRIRLLHPTGHKNFVEEIRWSPEENLEKRDGIDIESIELSPLDLAGFRMARKWSVANLLRKWGGGEAFKKLGKRSIENASAVGLITMPGFSYEDYYNAGRSLERVWITANGLNISIQPCTALVYLFYRLIEMKGEGLSSEVIEELKKIKNKFNTLFPEATSNAEIFLFRAFIADHPELKSLRRPLSEVLHITKDHD